MPPQPSLISKDPPTSYLPCATTCLLFQEERLLDQKEAISETEVCFFSWPYLLYCFKSIEQPKKKNDILDLTKI